MNEELWNRMAQPMGAPTALLIAMLVGLALMLVGFIARANSSTARDTMSLILFSFGAVLASIGFAGRLVAAGKWGYIFAFVPGILIGRHAVFLRIVRRQGILQREISEQERPSGMSDEDWRRFAPILERAHRAGEREFSADAIAIRYGLPALLTLAICIGAFELLQQNSDAIGHLLPLQHPWRGTMLRGARFGAVGAYIYALIYLGRRSVRRDVTSGAALWSAVTLALGPIMGAIVSVLWNPSGTTSSGWATDTLYLVAGISPRQAASIVEEAARRLWLPRDGSPSAAPRLGSLTQIRGIDGDTEERLEEEGITDAHSLAMADPLKLYRNTNFDMRLILSWIDEAYLFMKLPDTWIDLQNVGISGAIALATYGAKQGVDLKDLAGVAKITPSQLRDLVDRMYKDAQITLIWALYQFDEDGSGEDVGMGAPRAPLHLLAPQEAAPAGGLPAMGPWVAAAGLGIIAAYIWDIGLPWAPVVGMVGAAGIGALALVLRNNLSRDAAKRWGWRGGSAFAGSMLTAVGLVVGGYFLDRPDNEHKVPLGWLFAIASAVLSGIAVAQQGESAWAGWVKNQSGKTGLKLEISNPEAKVSVFPVEGHTRFLPVSPGSYRVEARAKGFQPTSEHVVILPEGQSEITMTMKALETRVSVSLEPIVSEAMIFLDGNEQSGLTFDAAPGEHKLTVRAKDYKNFEHIVDVLEGKVTPVNVHLTPLPAKLRVQVTPENAPDLSIHIDGASYGVSSFADGALSVELAQGTHKLEVTAEGYNKEIQQFDISNNENVVRQILLRKRG